MSRKIKRWTIYDIDHSIWLKNFLKKKIDNYFLYRNIPDIYRVYILTVIYITVYIYKP